MEVPIRWYVYPRLCRIPGSPLMLAPLAPAETPDSNQALACPGSTRTDRRLTRPVPAPLS